MSKDYARIQRNLAKMAEAGATASEMDNYASLERVTPREMRNYAKTRKMTGLSDRIISKATGGLSDKFSAVAGASADAIQGRGFDYRQNLDQIQSAARAYDEENPVRSGVARGLSFLTIPASRLAAAPTTLREMAKQGAIGGAAIGGIQGAGMAESGNELGGAAAGALGGATIGALAAPAIAKAAPLVQRGAQKLGDIFRAAPRTAEMVRRFERAGVTPSFATATDARTARGLSVGLEAIPGVGRPIEKALSRNLDEAAAAVQRQGASVRRTSAELGEAAKRGETSFRASSKAIGDDLYDAARRASPGATVEPARAVEALRQQVERLAKLPGTNKEAITAINRTLGDLTDEAGNLRRLDLDTARDMRTALRESMAQAGLRKTKTESDALAALGRLSDDIKSSLKPAQASAWLRADTFHRKRVEQIDDVIAKIVGPRGQLSEEQVASRIISMTGQRGDSARLSEFMRSVPASDRGDISAGVIEGLGGQGGAFSPAKWATGWEKMTPKAKAALFGKPLRDELENLAVVMRRLGQVDAARPRGSAPVQVGGGALVAAAGIVDPTVIGGAVTGAGMAKALSSPNFVRWLARNASTPVQQVSPQAVRQLSAIASQNPAIRNEVAAIQQRLAEAMQQSPGRLAAQEPDNAGAKPVKEQKK